ncbi:MAG: hypothetical protein JW955_24740 [Sedimentisphaerales bacterium]|nr:hypothetical protein [Sedimentisphaerales bacterium]
MNFRWAWVLVPLAALITWWFLSSVEPRGTWDELMSALHVRHRAEYTRLAYFGFAVVAIVGILRVFRRTDRD